MSGHYLCGVERKLHACNVCTGHTGSSLLQLTSKANVLAAPMPALNNTVLWLCSQSEQGSSWWLVCPCHCCSGLQCELPVVVGKPHQAQGYPCFSGAAPPPTTFDLLLTNSSIHSCNHPFMHVVTHLSHFTQSFTHRPRRVIQSCHC